VTGERLGEMGLFSLGQRQLWGDLTASPVPKGRSARRLKWTLHSSAGQEGEKQRA